MAQETKKNDESIKQDSCEQESMSHCSKEPACVCKAEGVFVASRYLSGIIACATMVIFCTFMVGFFAGKRFVVQSFLDKTSQDSFSDQVYASLCALTDKEIETASADDDAEDTSEETTEQDSVDGYDDTASRVAAITAIDSALQTINENLEAESLHEQKQDRTISQQNKSEQD